MSIGKGMIVHLTAGLIKKIYRDCKFIVWKWANIFPNRMNHGGDISVKVDLSNYATKADIKNIPMLILQVLH